MKDTPVILSVWRAIAGPMVYLTPSHSMAYYFPQGHIEQAVSNPGTTLSPHLHNSPYYLCIVFNVQLFADAITDEIYASITLIPADAPDTVFTKIPKFAYSMDSYAGDVGENVSSSAKTLTPADLNNLAEFTIPEHCADVLPPFGTQSKLQVKTLELYDVHGKLWKFKYINNTKKKKRIFSDGWKKFVEAKNIKVGDAVVFLSCNTWVRMIIGIRRADAARGRVSPSKVKEAIELASQCKDFQVEYYPNNARPNFVVKAGAVVEAMYDVWHPGMTVKFAVEIEETKKIRWIHGRIQSIVFNGLSPWPGTPWSIIQVKWDEPEKLKSYKWVNPWQLSLVTPECRTQHGDGRDPHPIYEKYCDEAMSQRLYYQSISHSTVEDFYLGK